MKRLVAPGSRVETALKAFIGHLRKAESLPDAEHDEVQLPPSKTAWRARIPGTALWLYYHATDEKLVLWLVRL